MSEAKDRSLVEASPDAVVMCDLTEREKAQAALRQSHDELQAIYDGTADGIVVFDIGSFQTLRVNAVLCELLGYSEAEIVRLTPEQKHPPEELPRLKAYYEATLAGCEAVLEEVAVRRKDGKLLYFDFLVKAIRYNNRPCQILFLHPASERRSARLALEQKRRTLQHMLRASDHERQLIAYDIHDGLAQDLAGALMQFQIYDHLKTTQPAEAQKAHDGGVALLRQGHFEARRLISGLRPPILDESGVVAAIAHLVHEPGYDQGPRIEFRSRVLFQRLPPVLENAIYRIVQEGLANARRYSQSPRVLVRLVQRGDRLRIEIRDWGVGFDPQANREGRFGLEGIGERARLLGGKCRIRSKPAAGAAIVVELPVVEQEVEGLPSKQ
jgi:PAS domain S-box-containing protein